MKLMLIVFTLCLAACAVSASEDELEARGKGKYALLIHFFYVVATKLFVLKIIYGALFYVIITKAWHFGLWFIHYLKEKKHDHYEYIEEHHDYDHNHHDYGHDGLYQYGHDGYYHGQSGYSQPYAYDKHGYDKSPGHKYASYGGSKYGGSGNSYKKVYDSDGSYSVKN